MSQIGNFKAGPSGPYTPRVGIDTKALRRAAAYRRLAKNQSEPLVAPASTEEMADIAQAELRDLRAGQQMLVKIRSERGR